MRWADRQVELELGVGFSVEQVEVGDGGNNLGEFGRWAFLVCRDLDKLLGCLAELMRAPAPAGTTAVAEHKPGKSLFGSFALAVYYPASQSHPLMGRWKKGHPCPVKD